MISVVTLLWQANAKSRDFSRCYDDSWARKLFDGFARHLTRPFAKVLLTDRPRDLPSDIEQIVQPDLGRGGYGDCIRAYGLDRPMILTGLDTVVTGNCDALADHCLTATRQALPRDPYNRGQACNGVALVPAGQRALADRHRGENDMDWVRRFPHAFIDDLFPGFVKSFKGDVKAGGLGDARIVYFHGQEKPHQLAGHPLIVEHWR